ncbi:hypothetical protein AAF712_010759 [Marasmius tenuissimus]|uniref:Uncharacterized protein n=1 Tax=Marasmius tenuissimus TaxID=585030 RepID=A0ABR2ZLU0_9AGAR
MASDSTHLANFGTASSWPIYMYLRNCTKYERGHPKFFTAHHLAYIPQIPDTVRDVYREAYNVPPSDEVIKHLKREVMQAVWNLIMDKEFVEVYDKSVVIKCSDKVKRRFLPEFFSYSVDYPEKIAVVCVKYLGTCLCVRCLIEKSQVNMDDEQRQRAVEDARWHIFTDGRGVESDPVKHLLDDRSLVPTRNVLSTKLLPFGFDLYLLLVIDLLHEFELGVWKAVLTHLIRMLYAQKPGKKKKDDAVEVLDERFHRVPTFGRSTIRRFHNNVSQMKKLAARDFEDILQCAMPCFEGLFNDKKIDKMVQNLLFDLAAWHAYSKLQLHTDSTVASFEDTTVQLGKSLRKFAKDSENFNTKETPREVKARGQRAVATAKRKPDTGKSTTTKKSGAQVKKFSLSTAKLHFLGDYPSAIKEYGTTDSYTTRNSECQHQQVKSFYRRMNKQNHGSQIVQHEGRKRLLSSIKAHIPTMVRQKRWGKKKLLAGSQESLPKTDPNICFHTSSGTEHRVLLSDINWVDEGDNGEVEEDIATRLNFTNDTVFAHKTIWFNFNTYDQQHDQDSVNTRLHPDVYTLSPDAVGNESEHPYQYAQVIGSFHAHVRVEPSLLTKKVPICQRMEFLWVRWYQVDKKYRAGFRAKHLYRLTFPPPEDVNAFGFLNPADIVRGIHIVPGFAHGPSETGMRLPANSLACQLVLLNSSGKRELEEDDWKFYYIGMFADRDTVMQFRGGGVGHPQFHEFLQFFETDAGVDAQILPCYDAGGEETTSPINNEVDSGAEEEEVEEAEVEEEEAKSSGSEEWVLSPAPSEHSNEDKVDCDLGEDDKDMEHAEL